MRIVVALAMVCGLALTLATPATEAAMNEIPGYTHGRPDLPTSPISPEELALIEESLLFGDEDREALRMSEAILAPQVEEILDVWYGFVGSKPQLLQYFSSADGKPDMEYLAAVRKRFGQWILDTARAKHDQDWLNYQHAIAVRHHRTGKNRTDKANAIDHIHFRYLPALFYPITATLKPFLAKSGHSAEQVEAMHQAWQKSVLLQVILWSHPYVRDGDF